MPRVVACVRPNPLVCHRACPRSRGFMDRWTAGPLGWGLNEVSPAFVDAATPLGLRAFPVVVLRHRVCSLIWLPVLRPLGRHSRRYGPVVVKHRWRWSRLRYGASTLQICCRASVLEVLAVALVSEPPEVRDRERVCVCVCVCVCVWARLWCSANGADVYVLHRPDVWGTVHPALAPSSLRPLPSSGGSADPRFVLRALLDVLLRVAHALGCLGPRPPAHQMGSLCLLSGSKGGG